MTVDFAAPPPLSPSLPQCNYERFDFWNEIKTLYGESTNQTTKGQESENKNSKFTDFHQRPGLTQIETRKKERKAKELILIYR